MRRTSNTAFLAFGALSISLVASSCSVLKDRVDRLPKLPNPIRAVNETLFTEYDPAPISDPSRTKALGRAWLEVQNRTRAVEVANRRMRIEATSAFIMDIETLEFDLLARAAGEAAERDFTRFTLLYLEYDRTGTSGILRPDYNLAESRWIGSYEAMIDNRNEQNLFGTKTGAGFKSLTGVVYFLYDDEQVTRDSFDVHQTYYNMLDQRARRNRY